MSEITKLYENAGELIEGQGWICKNPDHCTYQSLSIVPENCSECEYFEKERIYPLFTAEKQLELIKWLVHYIKQINITDAISGEFYFTAFGYVGNMKIDFEEALASLVNELWQNLTPEERQQIKEILNDTI